MNWKDLQPEAIYITCITLLSYTSYISSDLICMYIIIRNNKIIIILKIIIIIIVTYSNHDTFIIGS